MIKNSTSGKKSKEDELLKVIRFLEDVTTRIYGLTSRSAIYQTVCDAFRRFPSYTCSFCDVFADTGEIGMTHLSVGKMVLAGMEKWSGQRLGRDRVRIEHSPVYSRAVRERTAQFGTVLEMFKAAYPDKASSAIVKVVSLAGLKDRAIVAPLVLEDTVVGVFGMSSPLVTEDMLPSVNAFMRHLAVAVEMAEETKARIAAEEKLQHSLETTRELLRESTHRIRDNLQVITGLLDLQVRVLGGERAEQVLRQVRDRVRAIALVHEGLYATSGYRRVDLESYIRQLGKNVYATHHAVLDRPVFALEVEELDMTVSQLVPFGIVLNELVSNILQHAFPDGDFDGKRIIVQIRRHGSDLQAVIGSNGVPLPDSADPARAGTFGLQLVHMLVTGQLEGTITFSETPEKAWTLRFPYQESAGPEVPE